MNIEKLKKKKNTFIDKMKVSCRVQFRGGGGGLFLLTSFIASANCRIYSCLSTRMNRFYKFLTTESAFVSPSANTYLLVHTLPNSPISSLFSINFTNRNDTEYLCALGSLMKTVDFSASLYCPTRK